MLIELLSGLVLIACAILLLIVDDISFLSKQFEHISIGLWSTLHQTNSFRDAVAVDFNQFVIILLFSVVLTIYYSVPTKVNVFCVFFAYCYFFVEIVAVWKFQMKSHSSFTEYQLIISNTKIGSIRDR